VVEFEREKILAARPAGIAAALRGMAQRSDASSWLADVRVPALVIVGEHDAISTVAEMQSIAQRLPSARLEVIPKSGHMTPLEQPDVFNQVLDEFLRCPTL
jgi:pimeloyl-ACP methyl ester carboxylesterase